MTHILYSVYTNRERGVIMSRVKYRAYSNFNYSRDFGTKEQHLTEGGANPQIPTQPKKMCTLIQPSNMVTLSCLVKKN